MLNATVKFTIVKEDGYTIHSDYYTVPEVSGGEGYRWWPMSGSVEGGTSNAMNDETL